MPRNSSDLYIYVICEPDNNDKYFYIGASYNPQKSIIKLINHYPDSKVHRYLKRLGAENMVIKKRSPIKHFLGKPYEPEFTAGLDVLKWKVLAIVNINNLHLKDIGIDKWPLKTWYDELKLAGHPLLNEEGENNMAKGSAVGYVFAIIDPFTDEYCYVSNSTNPCKAIFHLLKYPYSTELKAWIERLVASYPNGFQVLEQEPISEFKNEEYVPEPRLPNTPLLKWEVLDEEVDSISKYGKDASVFEPETRKHYWIKKLKKEGVKLFNTIPGRPRIKKEA